MIFILLFNLNAYLHVRYHLSHFKCGFGPCQHDFNLKWTRTNRISGVFGRGLVKVWSGPCYGKRMVRALSASLSHISASVLLTYPNKRQIISKANLFSHRERAFPSHLFYRPFAIVKWHGCYWVTKTRSESESLKGPVPRNTLNALLCAASIRDPNLENCSIFRHQWLSSK